MKFQTMFAAALVTLSSFSVHAAVFNWSYTFGAGDGGVVVSGTLTGTQNGIFIENVSDVSVTFNGVPFTGATDFYQPHSFVAGCCFVGTGSVISTDGNLNNFYFSDAAPNTPSTNGFYMNGTDIDNTVGGPLSLRALRYAVVNINGVSMARDTIADNNAFYPGADGEFSAARWSITEASVPEPVTLLLMGLGLAGIGASRRTRQGA